MDNGRSCRKQQTEAVDGSSRQKHFKFRREIDYNSRVQSRQMEDARRW